MVGMEFGGGVQTVFADSADTTGVTQGQQVIVGAPAKDNPEGGDPRLLPGQSGYEFINYSQEVSNVFVQQTYTPVVYNNSASPSVYYWTGSKTVSASASASGSLADGWGPINASIGYNVNTSISQTYTTETSLTIPSHYYGWYEFGYAHSVWYGDYAYVNGNTGAVLSNEWITVDSPRFNKIKEMTSPTSPTNP